MEWPQAIFTVSFFAVPIAAGVVGYRHQGWLAAVLFPIDGLIAVMAATIGSLIFVAWLKHRSDRARVARLPTDELRALLVTPANPDFRFAFFELTKRGFDVSAARQLLLEMLTSNVALERDIALRRLVEIYPAVRRRFPFPPSEEPPDEVRAKVEAILAGMNAGTDTAK